MVYFVKHVRVNKISYLAIKDDGLFCRITIETKNMVQHAGWFDKDKTEADKALYISRMVNIGIVVTQEQFEEVQEFYAKNISKFFEGTLNPDITSKFINERNYNQEWTKDDMAGEMGVYKLDF